MSQRETGAHVVLTKARSWAGQQASVRVLRLRALAAGRGRTNSEHRVAVVGSEVLRGLSDPRGGALLKKRLRGVRSDKRR